DAMAWRLNGPAFIGFSGLEAKPLENAFNSSVVHRGAQKSPDSRPPQGDNGGLRFARVHIDDASIEGPACQFLDQNGRAITGEAGHLNVRSALESIGCFR